MSQKQFNNNNDPNNINSKSIDNSKQYEDYKINLNERLPICGAMGLKGICKRRGKCPAHPRQQQQQQQHTSFLLNNSNNSNINTDNSNNTISKNNSNNNNSNIININKNIQQNDNNKLLNISSLSNISSTSSTYSSSSSSSLNSSIQLNESPSNKSVCNMLQLPNPTTTTTTNTSTSTPIINKPRVIKNPKKFEKKIQQLYDFTKVIRLYKFQNDIQDDLLIQDIVKEYIRFILLKTINSDTCSNETDYKISLAPPTLIERFWYSHLSHTEEYKKYCGMFVGAFITCDPEINSEPLELQMLRFKTTLSLYILYFDNNINTNIWDYQDKASSIEKKQSAMEH